MSINIHGKEYVTVAERVVAAHEELKQLSVTTEVLFQEPVVVKATVVTPKGTFTGISAANPDKAIEKMSPYEVAETSAVGRALGFAGYGVVDSIATADEMNKIPTAPTKPAPKTIAGTATSGQPATDKQIGLITSLMLQKRNQVWKGDLLSRFEASKLIEQLMAEKTIDQAPPPDDSDIPF